MLGDGHAGKVGEGNGEDDKGEQPTQRARVRDLGKSIWSKSEAGSFKVKVGKGDMRVKSASLTFGYIWHMKR